MIDNGNISPTLDTGCEIGTITENIRIRKLTPRECFRLQGFPDEYFDRAAEVCSDAQLYKQAGNSVTVNVIFEIAKRLKEAEELDRNCIDCQYFGRDYENNDVRCNCKGSPYYLDVPPGEPCNYWESKA